MSFFMTFMMILMIANFGMSLSIFMERFGTFKVGIYDIRTQWAFFAINIALLFKKKIIVKTHIEYYSQYQATEHFYLLKTYKCSHERFYKLISGSYTAIVPERGILELTYDEKTFKTIL